MDVFLDDVTVVERQQPNLYAPGRYEFSTLSRVTDPEPHFSIITASAEPRFTISYGNINGSEPGSAGSYSRVVGSVFGDPSSSLSSESEAFDNDEFCAINFYKSTWGGFNLSELRIGFGSDTASWEQGGSLEFGNGDVVGEVFPELGLVLIKSDVAAPAGAGSSLDRFYDNLSSVSVSPVYEQAVLDISIELPDADGLSSSNPTFSIADEPHYTTVGYYDDKRRLVATTKLVEPEPAGTGMTKEFEIRL